MVALLSRALAKLDAMPEYAHCSPDCPGWVVVNAELEPEIQACDACWQQLDPPRRLTDTEAAELPVARDAVRAAREAIARRAQEAVRRRRMVVLDPETGRTFRSPCCNQPLTMWVTSRGVAGEQQGSSPILAADHACSGCGRLLQIPSEGVPSEPCLLHVLHHGNPLCGRLDGEPASWPDGHQWIGLEQAVRDGINAGAPPLCDGCHTALVEGKAAL